MNFVDQFFEELDKCIEHPIKIILTGAMAGIILGNIRPSMDIDFEIEFSPGDRASEKKSSEIERAIEETSKKLRIPAQYSESIQGWSQISFLDYKETATLYKKIGKVEVRLLTPEHWSIGKMTRYVELDEMDLVHVFKKQKVESKKIAKLWGRALKESSRSDKSREFKEHVTDFFKYQGRKVWGESFNPETATDLFRSAAGLV